MREIVRSNEPALISFVETLLREAGVDFEIFDRNISILEGSIGIFPRRVAVAEDDYRQARRVLIEAGLEAELSEAGSKAG